MTNTGHSTGKALGITGASMLAASITAPWTAATAPYAATMALAGILIAERGRRGGGNPPDLAECLTPATAMWAVAWVVPAGAWPALMGPLSLTSAISTAGAVERMAEAAVLGGAAVAFALMLLDLLGQASDRLARIGYGHKPPEKLVRSVRWIDRGAQSDPGRYEGATDFLVGPPSPPDGEEGRRRREAFLRQFMQ